MKFDFGYEGLSAEVDRFTIIGIQFEKKKRLALHLWLLGLGLTIIF